MAPIVTSLASIVKQFGIGAVISAPSGGGSGITATGGVISDYPSGGNVYRAHVFTSTGTFDVTALGTFGSNVEYLVVAGGGGGGSTQGGGGGGGGFRTGTGLPVSSSPGVYPITVGAGGAGNQTLNTNGNKGNDSVFSTIT